jgi:hypothetical protein
MRLKLTAVKLDCPDPIALATFYQHVTGMELVPESPADLAGITDGDHLWIGFQRVDGYQQPTWPNQQVPQQHHFDFAADDLDAAETFVLQLGAAKTDCQPGSGRWRIFTDPAGHPFCISTS